MGFVWINYIPFLAFRPYVCFYREKKDVRSLAALGVIYVVKTKWLEECDREKREVPVLRRHIAQDLLLPKGLLLSCEHLWSVSFISYSC